MSSNRCSYLPRAHCKNLSSVSGVKFTPREVDIISCVAAGRSTKGICQLLAIGSKTVETHRHNIMRKLDVSSREGILTFVEKSGEFSAVKNHYVSLLLYQSFTLSLKKIASLNASRDLTCCLAYSPQDKNSVSIIELLKKYLTLCGIQVLLEEKNEESLDCFLDQSENNQKTDYIFYIPPKWLIQALESSSAKKKKGTFSKSQNILNREKELFLLIHSECLKNMPDQITNIGYLDLSETDNFYLFFMKIVQKICSEKSYIGIFEEFKKDIENIQDMGVIPSSTENKNNREEQVHSHVFGNIKKFRLRLFSGVGLFFLFSLGFILFIKFSNQATKNDLKFASKQKSVRCELTIPHEDVRLERLSLLNKIDKQFGRGQQGIKAIALVGIGGSGKSVLARQYAQNHAGMVWEINAETNRSLMGSFENFANLLAVFHNEKKDIDEIVRILDPEKKERKIILFVKSHLRRSPGWLLIFDNVEQFSDIRHYFPSDVTVCGMGKVIITTRNSNMHTHNSLHHSFFIEELSSEEKLELFTKILDKNEEKNTLFSEKETRLFLMSIPPYPLDVSIAAHYLKSTNTHYNEYLREINDCKDSFDSFQMNVLNEVGSYSKTRYKIISLSLQKIIEKSKDYEDLFLLTGLLGARKIPKELLNQFKNPVLVDEFIHYSKRYSLVINSFLSSNAHLPCLNFHATTQKIILSYLLRKNNLNKTFLEDVSALLDNYIDGALEQEDYPRIKASANHTEAFLKKAGPLPDFITGLLKSKLGCLYYFLNEKKKAQKAIESSLKLLREALKSEQPEKHLKIAKAFLNVGHVYTELCEIEKAKDILEECLSIYNKASVPDYQNIAWGTFYLANAYRQSGYYDKSEKLLKESLRLQKKYDPSNYSRKARTLTCLGSVYRGLGKYERSLQVLEESLLLYKQHFHKSHYRVGWVLGYLGNVYKKLGHYEKSVKAFEESLRIYKRFLPKDHINMGLMMTYLGNSYRLAGSLNKAKEMLEQGLKIHKTNFNNDHERIGRVLFHLGKVHKDLGDSQKAKDLLDQSLLIYKNIQGKGDIESARLLKKMGDIHLSSGRLEEADKLLRQSLEILNLYQHPESFKSLSARAKVFLRKSQKAEQDTEASNRYKEQAIHFLNQALQIVHHHFQLNSVHANKLSSQIEEIKKSFFK